MWSSHMYMVSVISTNDEIKCIAPGLSSALGAIADFIRMVCIRPKVDEGYVRPVANLISMS